MLLLVGSLEVRVEVRRNRDGGTADLRVNE